MARTLTFLLKGKRYDTVPERIDRRKLYGWTQVIATDERGAACDLVSTDESGRYIIPRGGTSLGMLTHNGLWVERQSLVAVDGNGIPAPTHRSSYSTENELKKKVTVEEYLDHNITAFYSLDCPAQMISAIGQSIYTFEYTYLESPTTNPAFVMAAGEDTNRSLFMLVGYPNNFLMLDLEQPGWIDQSGEDDYEEDAEIDFAMF